MIEQETVLQILRFFEDYNMGLVLKLNQSRKACRKLMPNGISELGDLQAYTED